MYVCDWAKVCLGQTGQIIGLKQATYQQASNNFKNEMKSLTGKKKWTAKSLRAKKLYESQKQTRLNCWAWPMKPIKIERKNI